MRQPLLESSISALRNNVANINAAQYTDHQALRVRSGGLNPAALPQDTSQQHVVIQSRGLLRPRRQNALALSATAQANIDAQSQAMDQQITNQGLTDLLEDFMGYDADTTSKTLADLIVETVQSYPGRHSTWS